MPAISRKVMKRDRLRSMTLTLIMDHFTVVYFVAKPSISSEAEGDLVVIDRH